MKRLTVAAIVLTAGLAAAGCGDDDNGNNPTGPSTTGPVLFSAQLSAANEVPPITSNENGGRGTTNMTMNVPRDSAGVPSGPGTVTFVVQLTGLPAGTPIILGHIHVGATGVNGPTIVSTDLSAAAPSIVGASGTLNVNFADKAITAANAQALYANPAGYYVNFHSQQHPGGVVRGQIVRTQ
jgi:hypothetical protein